MKLKIKDREIAVERFTLLVKQESGIPLVNQAMSYCFKNLDSEKLEDMAREALEPVMGKATPLELNEEINKLLTGAKATLALDSLFEEREEKQMAIPVSWIFMTLLLVLTLVNSGFLIYIISIFK